MKKPLKIILILLALLIIILGVAWYVSRTKAKKAGMPPTTFSNFFGLSSKKTAGTDSNSTTLTSQFTDTTVVSGTTANGTGTGSADAENTTDNTQSSQFTSGPFAPTGNTDVTTGSSGGSNGSTGNGSGSGSSGTGNGSAGSGSGGGTSGSSGGSNGSTGNGSGSGSSGTGNGSAGSGSGGGTTNPGSINECSDADLNITFTPEELARLNILQQRFTTIASYLHTQSDLDVLQASYDSYKVKDDQIKELIVYCENTAPKITDPAFTRHVPTPFWHHVPGDPFVDSDTYSEAIATQPITGESATNISVLSLLSSSPLSGNTIIRDLETWLRLNLW